MGTEPKTTAGRPGFVGSDANFLAAFSHFLRQTPELWRMRRLDRFRPLDTNLVEHHVNLQGRINAPLFDYFLSSEEGSKLLIPDREVVVGDEITLYVPAIRQPKRLLLEFSALDESGNALSILTRYEGARVAAGYILTLLMRHLPARSDTELHHARLALATLMFQNPHDTALRLAAWARSRGEIFDERSQLGEAALKDWVESEGNTFLEAAQSNSGLGTRLRDLLEQPIREACDEGGMTRVIPPWAREGGLANFRRLPQLMLCSTRDVLKMVVEFADALPPPGKALGESPRDQLMQAPEQLTPHVARALRGLDVVSELIVAQRGRRDRSGEYELYRDLGRWTAYAVATVRIGVPFSLRFSHTWALPTPENWRPRWRRIERAVSGFYRTSQEYPLGNILKDANAVHIEITLPDQELRFAGGLASEKIAELMKRRPFLWIAPKRTRRVRRNRVGLVARFPDGEVAEADFGQVFGAIAWPSRQLLHLYSSRQRREAAHEDTLFQFLHILVPLRLIPAIFLAYLISAVAFLAGAGVVGYEFTRAAVTGVTPDQLEELITVTALAATLGLWLTTVHHARPITNAKILPSRVCFLLALTCFVATPLLFLGRKAVCAIPF